MPPDLSPLTAASSFRLFGLCERLDRRFKEEEPGEEVEGQDGRQREEGRVWVREEPGEEGVGIFAFIFILGLMLIRFGGVGGGTFPFAFYVAVEDESDGDGES